MEGRCQHAGDTRWSRALPSFAAVVLVVAAFGLAACSGSDESATEEPAAAATEAATVDAAATTEEAATSAEAATTEAATADITIGLVLPDYAQNELILAAKEGAEQAAEELGVELIVAPGSGEANVQVDAIESMIAAGVDVLVYDAIDEVAVAPAIEAVNEAGIPVVCIVSCAGSGDHAARIDFDYKESMGEPTGEWIAAQLPDGTGKVGFVDSNQVNPAVADIYEGITEGLAAAGADPATETSPPTNWDKAQALPIARNFLTANPDFDVLVCLHDLIAGTCIQAIDELGYGDIPLAGEGGTCEGINNILTGAQDFTVIQNLNPAGYQGVEIATQLAQGEPLAEDTIIIPMVPLTAEKAQAILDGTEEAVQNSVDVGSMLATCQESAS